MHYKTFFFYNVAGAFIWVTSLTFAGYFFGGLPFIRENFEYAVIGIVLVSLIPVVIEYIKHKYASTAKKKHEETSYEEIQQAFKKRTYKRLILLRMLYLF